MKVGHYNLLKIARATRVGLFLTDGESDVLLPNKYVPESFEIGQMIEVFLYLDHEERLVATTLKPYILPHDYAFLRVNYVNNYGAFLDWGLEKDLFVPYAEQATKMEQGKRYLVYAFIDPKSQRLVATSRIYRKLSNDAPSYEVGQQVELIIVNTSDLGVNVIVNKEHRGLVFKSDIFQDRLRPGDKHVGYIKSVRPDGKIDVTFQPTGIENIDISAEKILKELSKHRGFLPLGDHSNPDDIRSVLGMSKKNFKKAIGSLYKVGKITIEADGIKLK